MVEDSDFMQFEVHGDVVARLLCCTHGVDWPPPEYLEIGDVTFKRISMSEVPDADAMLLNVARGARYIRHDPPLSVKVPDLGRGWRLLH